MTDKMNEYDLFGTSAAATTSSTQQQQSHHHSHHRQQQDIAAEDSPTSIDDFSVFADSVTTFDPHGRIHFTLDSARDSDYDLPHQHQHQLQHPTPATHGSSTSSSSSDDDTRGGVPVMTICIMIVGTRGDVQPFVGIAKRLQQDGHRVRLATHAVYRDFVTDHGVEFYPLGGDPKELAAYMVKTGGHLIPYKYENLTKDVPGNMKMLKEILQTTWPAVSAPDPDALGAGVPGRPFQAQAIISNPVTYGHIHVAERLGVPLHIMFPQPWVPTVAFPHPLSNLPYDNTPQKKNYLSYKLVDLLMWQGTERMVNKFRTKTLGLRKLRKGDGGRDLLLDLEIPHAFMWSPALVPKPEDWGAKYDVIGTVLLKEAGSNYTPPPELEAFLGEHGDQGPIFVGFGSMVIENPAAMTQLIIEAARLAGNARVLIQSSWSDMAAGITVPNNVFFLGNCPHDWLMPRVCAVVHHGGAGTTAAGLLAGKPTFIVPFFGDQPFWGRAVVNAGVGVEPCPIAQLTAETLSDAFVKLHCNEMRARASQLQIVLQQEDGVGEAVRCFYSHLPLDAMRCAICETQLATKWSEQDSLRLCSECEMVITARDAKSAKHIRAYQCVDYRCHGPDSTLEGVASGTGAMIHEVCSGYLDWIVESKEGYRRHGAVGAVVGLTKGTIKGFVFRPMRAAVLFADHIVTGHHNAQRGTDDRKVGSMLLDNKPVAHTATMRPDERTHEKRKNKKKMVERAARGQVAVHPLTQDERRAITVRYQQLQSGATVETPPSQSQRLSEAELLFSQAPVHDNNIPKMTICMLATGAWRDSVYQFVAIAMRLQADGHRVRVASHELFRERIQQRGLEFYPLGGQVTTLADFWQHASSSDTAAADTRTGFFRSSKPTTRTSSHFDGLADLKALVFSLYTACTQPDPLTPALDFQADLILAQPQLVGHTMVTERLGVPLHWLSCSPPRDQDECSNAAEPPALYELLTGFRSSLGLSGFCSRNSKRRQELLTQWRVPHTLLWDTSIVSPSPPANESLRQVVAGFVELPSPTDTLLARETFAMVQSFASTNSSNTPILYVGLAISDWATALKEQLLVAIEAAAISVNARVIFQTIEDDTAGSSSGGGDPVLFSSRVVLQVLASTPVELLRPFVVGAIHCGDTAATASWLCGGVPSCVVAHSPQQTWGRAMAQCGVGLEPVDLALLSLPSTSGSTLCTLFQQLIHDHHGMRDAMSQRLSSGVNAMETTLHHIYECVPADAMRCDLAPSRVAHIYDPQKQLKLSYEAHMVVQEIQNNEDENACDETVKHKTKIREKREDTALLQLLKYRPIKYSHKKPPRFTLLESTDDTNTKSPSPRRHPHHHRKYDAPKHEERARLGRSGGLSGLALTRRGFVSRKKSMAATVQEAPTHWSCPETKQLRISAIHAKYESLMTVQSK